MISFYKLFICFTVNIEEPGIPKRKDKVEPEKKKPVVEKRGKDKDEKATDDYHYEKFKKQFRRF